LASQHVVNQYKVTCDDIEATVTALKQAVKETNNRYVQLDLTRQLALLNEFELHRKKWDLIVLQSYRDDLKGDNSLYMQFAPKYAELAKEQGARIILDSLKTTPPRTVTANPSPRFFQRKIAPTSNASPGKGIRSIRN
jgi:hypothetical protein